MVAGGPLVSVILPVYNGERYVRAALESVFAQTYRPLEVIVVDDGSTDGTPAAVRAFPDARYVRQPNRGPAAARNAALGLARGELVAFMDHDDLWTPDKLGVQVAHLAQHPSLAGVVAHFRHFLSDDVGEMPRLPEARFRGDRVGWCTPTLVVRRAVFDQVGLFDQTYRIGHDTDWFFRARERGFPLGVVRDCLVLKRTHNSNLTRRKDIVKAELLRSLKASIDRHRLRRESGTEGGSRG
jgi:glycosyltransferase involved in cell wall biosynthesis